jgi:predicted DNA-binding antitoxin AbrB/MazE fold protein
MLKTIKARYKNGVIEPLEEINIESGTEITITIGNLYLSEEDMAKRLKYMQLKGNMPLSVQIARILLSVNRKRSKWKDKL